MIMTVRQILFRDMNGCMDGNCIITGRRSGIQTNGGCHCMSNLSRGQLSLLKSRISLIADEEINLDPPPCKIER
jgi:hypothetical protein